MSQFSRLYERHSPPPAVIAILALEAVVAAVLLAIGIPGPVWVAYAVTVTLALLSPTVQELGRRQPKISVAAAGSEGPTLNPPRPRPWPIDATRIVTNETEEARDSLRAWNPTLERLGRMTTAFAIQPSEAEQEEARDKFEQKVDRFEDRLSDWLIQYEAAARKNADTFDLTVLVQNAASGSHAEAVTVVLDLPPTVEVVDERPTIDPPPSRPTYQPPRPTSAGAAFLRPPTYPTIAPPPRVKLDSLRHVLHRNPTWKINAGGRQLSTVVSDVHPNRAVQVDEPLLLRASEPGRHAIHWTAYSASARKEAKGALILEVPSDPHRPAFGRLQGIRSYPDVALVDAEGEIHRPERNTDPPPRPTDDLDEADPFEGLRQARALMEWQELGLDPANDGPESVHVGNARVSNQAS